MKIEIYGIPPEVTRCYGCESFVKLCDSLGLDFNFYPAIFKADTPIGFDFDRALIEQMTARAGKKKPPTTYPQIFVDNEWIGGYLSFKEFLIKKGFDIE